MDSHWVSHGVARSTQTTKLRICIHARTQRFRTILTQLSRDGHACGLHACVRRAVVRSSWRPVLRSSPKTEPTSRFRDTSRFRGISQSRDLLEFHANITFPLVSSSSSSSSFSSFGTPLLLRAIASFAPRIADKMNCRVP